MENTLIKTKDICKTYFNEGAETKAVCSVSFEIKRGEFVAIMGPSGSGKSTLMHLLGFLDRPSAGKYYFKGKALQNYLEDQLANIRNREIGFVFQTFNLLPRTTVFENVELPLLYSKKNFYKKEINKKVNSALESVAMGHRAGYFSNQLSGGEKQRVAIARALVNNPEIIFADEPTGNLDSKSGRQIMRILQHLNDEGKTIILVTHEKYTALHARRILEMVDGKITNDSQITERKFADRDELEK